MEFPTAILMTTRARLAQRIQNSSRRTRRCRHSSSRGVLRSLSGSLLLDTKVLAIKAPSREIGLRTNANLHTMPRRWDRRNTRQSTLGR